MYDEQNWQGSVDPSLPREVQAKQGAIIRLFAAIQEVGFEKATDDLPDIRFGESSQQFFGEAVDLHRWDWDGPPRGDDFPLVLTLRKDEPGLPEITERRTYQVRRSDSVFVIERTQTTERGAAR